MDIEFDDIGKISSVIMWLPQMTQVEIVSSLWNTSKKRGRTSYHKEVRYFNEAANKQLVNITLEFDTYVVINQIRPTSTGEKVFLMLHIPEIFILVNALDTMYSMITKDFNKIFQRKNGRAFIGKKLAPIEITLSKISNSYLILSPDIIEERNGDFVGGIRINLSSSTNYVIINMRQVIELKEKLKTDVLVHGQAMINYIGRPEFGYNLYQIGDGTQGEDDVIAPVKGRTVSSLNSSEKSKYFNLNGIL